MRVRFGRVTRGRGRIFVRVVSDGLPTGSTIRLSVRKADGSPMPSQLVRAADNETLVAVMAVVNCAQIATLEVINELGAPTASAEQVFSPRVTKVRSQANTAMRIQSALSIRNIDDVSPKGPMTMSVHYLVTDVDGADVIHGITRIASCDGKAVSAPVDLCAFDENGSVVDRSFTIFNDEIRRDDVNTDVLVRQISFSAHVPSSASSVILWANSEHAAIGGCFECMYGDQLAQARDRWLQTTLSAQFDPRYEGWFLAHHRTAGVVLEQQRTKRFDVEPTFSFVVPLFHTPTTFLKEMAASVLGQTYGRLELILVNASPDDPELIAGVDTLLTSDERVRVVTLEHNLGITENTNKGIEVATGDFICFLDHDDVIEPDLLYWYAKAVNDYPETDLIYCDEDKLDEDGHYFMPLFKPDWSPELLCSSNYVCHLLAVRCSLVRELTPPTHEFDGAQDHHMTFRVSERARNIYHVRRVLYHWRSHPGSTAFNAQAKDYTIEAGRRAIEAHLDRCGISGQVTPDVAVANTFHISFAIQGAPLISIIIPNKDQSTILERCVTSIFERSSYRSFEIVIVENNSVEAETFRLYERLQSTYGNVRVVVLEGMRSFSFSRAINFGVRHSTGSHLLLLNNDIEVISPDWLESLLGPLQIDGVGITGAKLLYPDGTVQHGGVMFHRSAPDHLGKLLPDNYHSYYNMLNLMQNLSAVTGACLMTSRSVYDEVGGFDEELAVSYNDIDFCLRARAHGWRVVYRPEAVLYHYESVSRGVDYIDQPTSGSLRFCKENGIMMQRWARYYTYGDPYLSPSFMPHPWYRQLRFD